jgi:hypothetical protein
MFAVLKSCLNEFGTFFLPAVKVLLTTSVCVLTSFGISLNCKFGTDKAARYGGYRAAQPSAPTVPVGTCRHHKLPVGTCRHLQPRSRTDVGSVTVRMVTGSVLNVGPISALESVALRQSIGSIKYTSKVYRPGLFGAVRSFVGIMNRDIKYIDFSLAAVARYHPAVSCSVQ